MSTNTTKLSVYAILLNQDNHILFQKRANTSFASGFWSLPGGHVESDESLTAAVIRELKEELNILVNSDDCLHQLTLVRKPQKETRYINFFYSINSWQGVPSISDNKASELTFFPTHQLPQPILPYIEEALAQIKNKTIFYESDL